MKRPEFLNFTLAWFFQKNLFSVKTKSEVTKYKQRLQKFGIENPFANLWQVRFEKMNLKQNKHYTRKKKFWNKKEQYLDVSYILSSLFKIHKKNNKQSWKLNLKKFNIKSYNNAIILYGQMRCKRQTKVKVSFAFSNTCYRYACVHAHVKNHKVKIINIKKFAAIALSSKNKGQLYRNRDLLINLSFLITYSAAYKFCRISGFRNKYTLDEQGIYTNWKIYRQLSDTIGSFNTKLKLNKISLISNYKNAQTLTFLLYEQFRATFTKFKEIKTNLHKCRNHERLLKSSRQVDFNKIYVKIKKNNELDSFDEVIKINKILNKLLSSYKYATSKDIRLKQLRSKKAASFNLFCRAYNHRLLQKPVIESYKDRTAATLNNFTIFFLRKEKSYTKLKYSRVPQYDSSAGAVAALLAGFLAFIILEKFGFELVDSGDIYVALMYIVSLVLIFRIYLKSSERARYPIPVYSPRWWFISINEGVDSFSSILNSVHSRWLRTRRNRYVIINYIAKIILF